MSETYPWEQYPLHELEAKGIATLGRGNIISKIDIQTNPGGYPIYSSSAKGEGLFGTYGDYMFDEEMITWSVDGGGNLFYRPRHRFSVTNVSGYMRLDTSVLDYRFAHAALALQHSKLTFDYQTKAHPSVIRNLYYLPIPPLPEQKKIAEILSGIDRSISNNTNKIISLETLYTSLLADSLRRLPGDCLDIQLADACTEVFLGLTSKVDYVEGEGIPLIRASNIRNGLIDFDSARHISHEQHLSLTKYRKAGRGDVLVTKSGSLGECAIVHSEKEFSIYESIVCLKPKPDILSTEYLFHAMQCSAVKDQYLSGKVGSAVAHLNLNDFRRITLPLPSLDDQKIISKALDAVQSSKERLQESTNRKILLKNALSADLLSGRKRVSV
jgi:type I restriction enzyme S subunit